MPIGWKYKLLSFNLKCTVLYMFQTKPTTIEKSCASFIGHFYTLWMWYQRLIVWLKISIIGIPFHNIIMINVRVMCGRREHQMTLLTFTNIPTPLPQKYKFLVRLLCGLKLFRAFHPLIYLSRLKYNHLVVYQSYMIYNDSIKVCRKCHPLRSPFIQHPNLHSV